uniref:Uncharacterized protein n=1 Tax=Setaria italica TaxID=4555 RepID=K4APA3_SETIT
MVNIRCTCLLPSYIHGRIQDLGWVSCSQGPAPIAPLAQPCRGHKFT